MTRSAGLETRKRISPRPAALGDSRETGGDRRLRLVEAACLFIVLLSVVAAFWPALSAQFINWDDYGSITTNERFRGFDAARLKWMFTTDLMGHYQPLSWMTLAFDHTCWGLRAGGYHFTNVALHALNAVLVGVLANRLMRIARSTNARPAPNSFADVAAATLAALLFGVHPMRVESVAWITERRDVLSTFFALLCVLSHVRYAGMLANDRATHPRRWYIASIGFFLLALLSKAIVVVLPAVLLALDVYPLRRLELNPSRWMREPSKRSLIEKVPHAILAAIFSYIILSIQQTLIEPLGRHDLISRLAQASFGLAYYPRASIWPAHLLPIYELPLPLVWKQPTFTLSMLAVAATVAVVAVLARRMPALALATACYLAFALPVSGVFQTGPQMVADRYSYVSMIGFTMLAAAACSRWGFASRVQGVRIASAFLAIATVVALGVSTWRYAARWQTSKKLWSYVLSQKEDHAFAHSLLGAALIEEKNPREAMPHYRRALELRPGMLEASYTLSRTAFVQGDIDEAERVARAGLTHWPDNLTLKRLVGECLLSRRDWVGAAAVYEQVLKADPGIASAQANLGISLGELGRIEEAMGHLQRAAALQPERPQPFIVMARLTWTHTHDAGKSRELLRQALQRDPRNAAALELMRQIDSTQPVSPAIRP